MRKLHKSWARVYVGACVAAAALVGCAASEPGEPGAAVEQEGGGDRAALLRWLPQVTELPPGYRPVGPLADRGMFYADGERPSARLDDGDHYHGYDGPGVWAREPKGLRTQGVLYGIEDSAVVSAGYLIRQADLVASKSFHGLTLRELGFPAARSMTVDLIKGETADSNQYLLLWHFLSGESSPRPMLGVEELPLLTSLPDEFVVYACDQYPDAFCPGMGRHYTDPTSVARFAEAVGNEGVIYGEAAGKLIFIEYVFTQENLAAGISWPAMPLDGLLIPPIDNAHVLHFGAPGSTSGVYTVHMYFLPEDIYLAWETEPETL